MIRQDIVVHYGMEVEPYLGEEVEGIHKGPCVMPQGQVKIRLSFPKGGRRISYDAVLFVLDGDLNFDIAIGREIINSAKIYVHNPDGYVAHWKKATPSKTRVLERNAPISADIT